MTSREEADQLRSGIAAAFLALEDMGFSRGQVAASMIGISLSEYLKHNGAGETLRVWNRLRSEVLDATINPTEKDDGHGRG